MQIESKICIRLSDEDMEPFFQVEEILIEILREVEGTDNYIEDPSGNEISENFIRGLYNKIAEITR